MRKTEKEKMFALAWQYWRLYKKYAHDSHYSALYSGKYFALCEAFDLTGIGEEYSNWENNKRWGEENFWNI